MEAGPAATSFLAIASPGRGTEPPAEDRLVALARSSGPLRRVLAALAARLLDLRSAEGESACERLGYARLGDYARERLGVSGRTLQELARVGRQLAGLPGLEAALVSGGLPWSKVRLLARFVTPDDEACWIARAYALRVRALERSLRSVDRGALETAGLARSLPETDEEGMELEPCDRIVLRGPPALCFEWRRAREYASRVAGARLPDGALLEMVTAEVLSALPLDEDPAPADGAEVAGPESRETALRALAGGALAASPAADVCASHGHAEDGVSGAAPSAELPAFLRALLAGLAGADAFEVDARLRRALRLEQRLDAEIARALRSVTSPEYTWRERHFTVSRLARERLGMSPRKARALLRLERVSEGCPALRRAFREGRLSWVQAQALLPVLAASAEADLSWCEAWVEFAGEVSVRRLEDAVSDGLAAREAAPDLWQTLRAHPDRFGAGAGPGDPGERQTCARPRDADRSLAAARSWLGTVRIQIRAPRDVSRLFRATLCSVRRALERQTGRLPSEAEGFRAMLHHALRSWGVDDLWLSRRIRRQYRVFERDGWRCTVPGCSARRNLHAHHVVFRSQGGSDALSNQTTLCAVHHQRGVHAGRVRIVGRAPGGLVYELGLRPGLPPLERYRSGDRKNAAVA